jgi:hypothetical protein
MSLLKVASDILKLAREIAEQGIEKLDPWNKTPYGDALKMMQKKFTIAAQNAKVEKAESVNTARKMLIDLVNLAQEYDKTVDWLIAQAEKKAIGKEIDSFAVADAKLLLKNIHEAVFHPNLLGPRLDGQFFVELNDAIYSHLKDAFDNKEGTVLRALCGKFATKVYNVSKVLKLA